MNIWCMNLKDNRNFEKRNKDPELKFKLCKEESIITIGWSVEGRTNSWDEYKEIADKVYKNDRGYIAARNALEKVSYGDLVWTKNPVKGIYYIAEVTDKSAAPTIYNGLKNFDTFAYKKCRFLEVPKDYITGPVNKDRIVARRALEKMGTEKRGNTIIATIELFNRIKGEKNENDK